MILLNICVWITDHSYRQRLYHTVSTLYNVSFQAKPGFSKVAYGLEDRLRVESSYRVPFEKP